MTAVIKKVLAGAEDLLLGEGTESQTRGSVDVVVNKINAEWIFSSISQVKALDTGRYKHAKIIDSNGNTKNYDYAGSSTASGNDQDVLQPTIGSGRWLLRKANNTQTQNTATGTGGVSTSTHTDIPTGFIIVTNYNDDTQTPGTGQSYIYTGVTIIGKAGHWPDADGFYYDADGKQFAIYDPANLPTGVNTITATTYTFVKTDACIAGGKAIVVFNNAAAQAVTIPPNSAVKFPLGIPINLIQNGAGKVTLVAGAGVTIHGGLSTTGQYNALSCVQVALNEWVIIGGKTITTSAGATVQLSPQDLTTTSGLCGVMLTASGEMTLVDNAGNTELPNEWCSPKTPNIGSLFDVRMVTITGATNIGSLTNVWIPLTDVKGWGISEVGTTLTYSGTLEIRVHATGVVVDSALIQLESTHV
jgi:hypothetical protein